MLSSLKSMGDLNSYPDRDLLYSLRAAGTKECLSLSARQGREGSHPLLHASTQPGRRTGAGRGYGASPAASSNKGPSLIPTPSSFFTSLSNTFVPLSLQTTTRT